MVRLRSEQDVWPGAYHVGLEAKGFKAPFVAQNLNVWPQCSVAFSGSILILVAAPTLCMIVATFFAGKFEATRFWRSVILHAAAGVVFSVVAVEILPDVMKRHLPWETALGFAGGVVTMLGIRAYAERAQARAADKNGIPWGLIGGIGVDVGMDGLLLGVALAAGGAASLLLCIALAIELISLGLAVGAELRQRKLTQRCRWVGPALGAAFAICALVSAAISSRLSVEALDMALAFGVAALLFLTTEELLVEAHEEEEGLVQTSSFFLGFLLFLILGMFV